MFQKRISSAAAMLSCFFFGILVDPSKGLCTSTAVTLANFTVDSSYTGSITDQPSGVVFSNPRSANNNFIIDYWNSYSSLPDLTPGLVVSSNGYVGGGGISLPYDFGMTITFPHLVSAVDMYAGYSTNGTDSALSMSAYGATGNLLNTANLSFPTRSSFVDAPFDISEGSNSISYVQITPTDVFDAFGKISFSTAVPEPGSIAIFAVGISCTLLRRRIRR